MKTKVQPAPKSLSTEAKSVWQRLMKDYDISDEGGLLLLQTGLESFDRMRDCQKIISRDGPMVLDRWGQRKSHSLLPAERDARSQMLAALKALHLDVEPLHDGPGRPKGS